MFKSSTIVVPVMPSFEGEETARTFDELAKIYLDYQEQLIGAEARLKSLVGDSDNPGSLWRMIELFGAPTNKADPQEHAIQHGGKIWSLVRKPSKLVWDETNGLDLFRLASQLLKAADQSDEQAVLFDQFQCMLEKLLDDEVKLTGDAWWDLISRAAELHYSAVKKCLDTDFLDQNGPGLPPLLVSALCSVPEAQYTVESSEAEQTQLAHHSHVVVNQCGVCDGSVDEEDFFCRHCGHSQGHE